MRWDQEAARAENGHLLLRRPRSTHHGFPPRAAAAYNLVLAVLAAVLHAVAVSGWHSPDVYEMPATESISYIDPAVDCRAQNAGVPELLEMCP